MMKHCLSSLACVMALATVSANLHAQALPAASRGGVLQGGLAVSNASTDYVLKRSTGISGYATFDFTPHLGIEADVHFLTLITSQDFAEQTYLIGPRYVYRKGRFEPYARVMIGLGRAYNQDVIFYYPTLAYSGMVFAFGGGLDIRLPHNINVRAIDFEDQSWSGFPPNGLSPSIISVGAAYRFR